MSTQDSHRVLAVDGGQQVPNMQATTDQSAGPNAIPNGNNVPVHGGQHRLEVSATTIAPGIQSSMSTTSMQSGQQCVEFAFKDVTDYLKKSDSWKEFRNAGIRSRMEGLVLGVSAQYWSDDDRILISSHLHYPQVFLGKWKEALDAQAVVKAAWLEGLRKATLAIAALEGERAMQTSTTAAASKVEVHPPVVVSAALSAEQTKPSAPVVKATKADKPGLGSKAGGGVGRQLTLSMKPKVDKGATVLSPSQGKYTPPSYQNKKTTPASVASMYSSGDDISEGGSSADDSEWSDVPERKFKMHEQRSLLKAAREVFAPRLKEAAEVWEDAAMVARGVTSFRPSATLSVMTLGSGLFLPTVTEGLYRVSAKVDKKGSVTIKVMCILGPKGTASTGPPIHADGHGLRLIPWSAADVSNILKITKAISFPLTKVPGMADAEALELRMTWDAFVDKFVERATRVLGGWGDGPWNGHSHRCAMYIWVCVWLVFWRSIAHAMLVKDGARSLLASLEDVWREADQAQMFPTDPASIPAEEALAVFTIMGVACESCGMAGVVSQTCPSCKTSSLPGGVRQITPANREAYKKDLDAFKAKDPARVSMKPEALAAAFKATAEGSKYAFESRPMITMATSVALMTKNLNKLPQPLRAPLYVYKSKR